MLLMFGLISYLAQDWGAYLDLSSYCRNLYIAPVSSFLLRGSSWRPQLVACVLVGWGGYSGFVNIVGIDRGLGISNGFWDLVVLLGSGGFWRELNGALGSMIGLLGILFCFDAAGCAF